MHTVNQCFALVLFGLSIWLISRFLPGAFVLTLWGMLCFLGAFLLGTFSKKARFSSRFGFLLLLYGALLLAGAWQGEDNPLKPLTLNPWRNANTCAQNAATIPSVRTLAALSAAQTQAISEGRPLLVIFYADWCASCKTLEHTVFTPEILMHSLAGWNIVRVDVTHYGKESQSLLKKFALVGPPATLFFNKKGVEQSDSRLIGVFSPEKLHEQLGLMQLSAANFAEVSDCS